MDILLAYAITAFISSLIALCLISCACWVGILLNKDVISIFTCSVLLGIAYVNACYLFVNLFYL